jgi:putative PIN family toxin of toxin-antitoxin system
VIEESLRRDLKLDVLDDLWANSTMSEAEASELAVVDVSVLISGVLSGAGASAEVLRASRDGLFELVVSEMLLTELQRTLGYPKLRKRIAPEKAATFLDWVRDHGRLADDPAHPAAVASRDPDDDYLLALAIEQRAYLVTGDEDLLVLSADLPILTPPQFASKLRETR